MGKVVRKTIVLLFFIFLVIVLLCLGSVVFKLDEEVYKLRNSSDEMAIKLHELNDMTDSMWRERAFEKEMKENLSYYLPDGFRSTVKYTGLTPIDLELGQARVTFTHRYKNYSIDFSYSYNEKGWDIVQISEVRQIE